jgi:hypothetical protein
MHGGLLKRQRSNTPLRVIRLLVARSLIEQSLSPEESEAASHAVKQHGLDSSHQQRRPRLSAGHA